MMRDTFDILSNDNSLFVTAQCNNRCLMCSQPPLKRDDIALHFQKNLELLESAPLGLTEIGITGGEPTLLGERLFLLIQKIREKLPETKIHILSNGRAFADKGYAKELKSSGGDKLLLGIPLHSDYEHDHDYIAQAEGAYSESIKGLYHLAECDVDIELRIVINKVNYTRLYPLSNFIYKNLPFVTYTSFMGMEDTGYTIKNRDVIWIEPEEYSVFLEKAVINLVTWGIDASIFNLPLCCIPETLHEFAHKSISDWKVRFLPECNNCELQKECCGLFSTSRNSFKIMPFNLKE